MLGDEGYTLTLLSRTREKIEHAAGELGVGAVAADVADPGACARGRRAPEALRATRLLVNAAGIGIAGTVEQLAGKHFDLQVGVNLRGPYAGGHSGAPPVARAHRKPRVDRGNDADARAGRVRRDEGWNHLADAVAE